jgi:hypothetical protein
MIRAIVLGALLATCWQVKAQSCRVHDPELQASYAGPCVGGFAEGTGHAMGSAEYRGEFRAGRKHGGGIKTWANGDRYDGEFFEDRIEGFGVYTFGRGPWAGERYEGDYVAGRRHGHGVYRWATGDVYRGPWRDDTAIGPSTPMMRAQARWREEARAAVARPGQKVCRELPLGIGARDWVRGTVVAVTEDKVAVRIDDPGSGANALAAFLKPGEAVWDVPHAWTLCY